jgi:hypothetical protein
MNLMRARICTVCVPNLNNLSLTSGRFFSFIVLVEGLNTHMSQSKELVYTRVQDQRKIIIK